MDSEPNIRNKLSRGKFKAVFYSMLRGYRGIVCAIVGLTLWGQAPPAKGVPSPSPAPKEQPSQSAQPGNGKPKPLAVTIAENTEQAEASERGEAESKQHDARDLDAQIRAANAAEEQIFPAWLGALLSFAGTALIVWTLILTRKANEITRSGQRAWMTDAVPVKTAAINSSFAGMNYNNAMGFHHVWENTGATPAREARCLTTISIVAFNAKPERHTFPPPEEEAQIVGPAKEIAGPTRMLSDQQTAAFRAQTCKVFIYSRIEYYDIFESDLLRISEACHEAFAHGGTINDDPTRDVSYRAVGTQNTLT